MIVVETVMEEAEARRLCEEIRNDLANIAPKVLALRAGQAWRTLGYATWEDLVQVEFGGPIRLSKTDRSEAAKQLRAGGVTYKDIASTFGVSQTTAYREASEDELFQNGKVHSDDGKLRPASYTSRAPRPTPPVGRMPTDEELAIAEEIRADALSEEWMDPWDAAITALRDAQAWAEREDFTSRRQDHLEQLRNELADAAGILRRITELVEGAS